MKSGIIKKPIITEKASIASENRNIFTFLVDRGANKLEIKNAIEKMYGVNVKKVRTQVYGGGVSSTKYTNKGIVNQPNNPYKKAMVTVNEGQTIELFNNY